MDVVLQDFDETILVSARIELNERKIRGLHELSDTFELCNHMRMAWATECIAARRVSFTLLQTSRAHPSTDHRLESRMREIRLSGSEGGGALTGSPYPYRGLTAGARDPSPPLRGPSPRCGEERDLGGEVSLGLRGRNVPSTRGLRLPSPHFSQAFVARQRRAAWMRGARRFRDEGIVDTMLRSETVVQRSRQAAIRCRSRRSVRNAG